MKKSVVIFFGCACLLTFIAGCGKEPDNGNDKPIINYFDANSDGTATIRIYKNDKEKDLKNRYIPSSKVNLKHTYTELSGALSNNRSVCPSTGDVNLLVIPVHIPGDEAFKTDKVKEDIETMFFSENSKKMGYKSVKEYYYESSYGKLNFGGKVTDWFDVSLAGFNSAEDVIKNGGGSHNSIKTILDKACEWAIKVQKLDLQEFDKNRDGLIDAVWLVYDHLDFTTEDKYIATGFNGYEGNLNNLDSNTFWNFTGWDYTLAAADYSKDKTAQPAPSAFSWSSFSMMYTSYCDMVKKEVTYPGLGNSIIEVPSWDDETPVDSHTFIHETGHLLGLNDLYATDNTNYRPAGQKTMMDQNIGDLDSYSKLLLGWVTPYVVYGSSEIVIAKETTNDRSVIVIPYNYEEISKQVERTKDVDNFQYSFNPFSEYLLIDLYTPDGLNELDKDKPINSRIDMPMMSSSGVRIYHIDSRIFKCTVVEGSGEEGDEGQTFIYDADPTWNGDYANVGTNQAILMPISNNYQISPAFQLDDSYSYFDECRLLEASGLNTFSSGEAATNTTLWNTNSNDFEIDNFGLSFFNAKYTFNHGEECPFKIGVTTLRGI